jgi:1-phosphatidylinositol-4-phosphate 5-kinase
VFFLTDDDRFIIKTMTKAEMLMLRRILLSYYRHITSHPDTLITKFYGLHRVKPHRGRRVRTSRHPPQQHTHTHTAPSQAHQ